MYSICAWDEGNLVEQNKFNMLGIVQTRLRTQRYVNKEMEQARRVARIYLISFAYGVDKVFWYNFRSYEKDPYYTEDNFGIVHSDLTPKPAYYAYKTMTTLCPSGSTRPVLEVVWRYLQSALDSSRRKSYLGCLESER